MKTILLLLLLLASVGALLFARPVSTGPVIGDMGYCPDVTSPVCPARFYYPRMDRVFAVGTEAYYFVSQERPARVAFVTRAVYASFSIGEHAPDGLRWRERAP